jgi:hypothetical protein
MSWVMASGVRGTLTRTAVAAAIAGVAVIGATVPANATHAGAGLPGVPVPLRPPAVQDDPGCEMFGWRHPLCAGGAFDSPPDDGIPGDNAAEGGYRARRWCRTSTARSAPLHAWGHIAQATTQTTAVEAIPFVIPST